MSEKILQLNEGIIKEEMRELVWSGGEETLNGFLEKEADELVNASKCECAAKLEGYSVGHYERNLASTSSEITLKIPKLKVVTFETAIIERYRRRESSVEVWNVFGWCIRP